MNEAAILDMFTRRIVGRAMSKHVTAGLTTSALKVAIREHRSGTGLIHHSDQGSQYTDGTYQALWKDHGVQVSMNGVGIRHDNAPIESFFGTLKSKLVHHVYVTPATRRGLQLDRSPGAGRARLLLPPESDGQLGASGDVRAGGWPSAGGRVARLLPAYDRVGAEGKETGHPTCG